MHENLTHGPSPWALEEGQQVREDWSRTGRPGVWLWGEGWNNSHRVAVLSPAPILPTDAIFPESGTPLHKASTWGDALPHPANSLRPHWAKLCTLLVVDSLDLGCFS